MQNDSDFLVRNPKRVVEYLTEIFKHKCIISAHFGETNQSFLTAILEIDPIQNIIKIDSAPSELLNKQLLTSAKILFRTQFDGIKVSFSGKSIKKSKSNGLPAFEMPIPGAIFWMQRRQFYRVKVPLAHTGSFCEITFRPEDDMTSSAPRIARFRLADLSINGCAILNPEPELADQFEFGKSFTDCRLFLHESTHANIGFVIRNITEIKVSANSTQQRIGCSFTQMSTNFDSSIQLYMQDIERQLKNIG